MLIRRKLTKLLLPDNNSQHNSSANANEGERRHSTVVIPYLRGTIFRFLGPYRVTMNPKTFKKRFLSNKLFRKHCPQRDDFKIFEIDKVDQKKIWTCAPFTYSPWHSSTSHWHPHHQPSIPSPPPLLCLSHSPSMWHSIRQSFTNSTTNEFLFCHVLSSWSLTEHTQSLPKSSK